MHVTFSTTPLKCCHFTLQNVKRDKMTNDELNLESSQVPDILLNYLIWQKLFYLIVIMFYLHRLLPKNKTSVYI